MKKENKSKSGKNTLSALLARFNEYKEKQKEKTTRKSGLAPARRLFCFRIVGKIKKFCNLLAFSFNR